MIPIKVKCETNHVLINEVVERSGIIDYLYDEGNTVDIIQ